MGYKKHHFVSGHILKASEMNEIEDGIVNVENQIPNPVVNSVNGQSGAVTLKTGDLENNSGFITKAVTDLTNYYLKSETYSRDEINQRISQIPKFTISVVSALPTANISETTIYLVGGGVEGDLYTEYIYAGGKWEILGSQRVDLTGYATETWVTGQLGSYLKASELEGAINTALAQAAASGEFDGADGVGVAGVSVTKSPDENGFLYIIIELTDGQIQHIPYKNGEDGFSPAARVEKTNNGVTITITDKNGTTSETVENGEPGYTPQKGKDYFDGTSVTVSSVSEITADGGTNTVTFSDGKKLNIRNGSKGSKGDKGDTGQRGTSLLNVTTAPTAYNTAVNGITPAYRIALSTVKTQSGATEVLVGDTVRYSYYVYPVVYVDASYVYCGTRVSIRGAGGTDGKTPVKGTDYWTDADQESIVQQVISTLQTPVFGRVEDGNIIVLTGELADGTYTIAYEDAEGNATEIGTLEKAPKPLYTNILTVYELHLNKRWSGSGKSWSDCNGMLGIKVPIADVKDKTIRWRGFPKNAQASTQSARWYSVKTDGTASAGTFVSAATGGGTDDLWNSKVVDEGNNTFSIAYNAANMANYGTTTYTHLMMNMPVKTSEAITEADIANLIMVIDEQIPD